MNDPVIGRLNAIDWFFKNNGWIASVDAIWLKNWLGKDGDPKLLLDEAIKQKQLELITERLTGVSQQTIQTPNFFPASF